MSETGEHRITVFPGFGIGPELSDGISGLFDALCSHAPHPLRLATSRLRAEDRNHSSTYCRRVLSEIRDKESLGVRAFVLGPHPANVLSDLRRQLNILFKHQVIGAYTTRACLISPLKKSIASAISLNLYRICVPSIYSLLSRGEASTCDCLPDSTEAIPTRLRSALRILKALCPLSSSVFLAKYDYDMPGHNVVREEMRSYVLMNPDTGLVKLLDGKIKNAICMDLEGDIIGDLLEYLVNGTKNVGYATNCSESDSRYYQTLHGEARDLVGDGSASPIAMIRALAAAIRQDRRLASTADRLDVATATVYRRQGLFGKSTTQTVSDIEQLFSRSVSP